MPSTRITYRQQLQGRLTAVGPGLVDVELSAPDETPLGSGPALASQLVFRSERAFRGKGAIAFRDGQRLELTTLGHGDLAEPADGGVRHGTAVLEVRGVGRLSGAHGRITSNFVVGADGAVTDEQVVVLFIDKQGGEGS